MQRRRQLGACCTSYKAHFAQLSRVLIAIFAGGRSRSGGWRSGAAAVPAARALQVVLWWACDIMAA